MFSVFHNRHSEDSSSIQLLGKGCTTEIDKQDLPHQKIYPQNIKTFLASKDMLRWFLTQKSKDHMHHKGSYKSEHKTLFIKLFVYFEISFLLRERRKVPQLVSVYISTQ